VQDCGASESWNWRCISAHLAETSPARRSFYVFSRGGDVARTAALAEAITGTPSALLSADRAAAGEPGATPSHPVE